MGKKSLILTFIFALSLVNNALASPQPDYIRSWLICGPFEDAKLETEPFKNEAEIAPQAGKTSGGKVWKIYSPLENKLNFEEQEAFGPYDNCVGYAYIEVKSPKKKELRLFLGSDDGLKVWLNGRNILTNDIPRGFGFDQDKLNVILEPGWNRLLLKVNDIGGGWVLSARFSDHRGLPVSNLEYRPKALSLKGLSVKEVTASSIEANRSSLSPEKAVDADPSTRWSSQGKDPQWICLDLGTPTEISRVVLLWEAACAVEYKIEVSNDKENWTKVYSTTSGNGGKDIILLKEPETARYIRLYVTKRVNESWGYSLWEFQVFG